MTKEQKDREVLEWLQRKSIEVFNDDFKKAKNSKEKTRHISDL